jgi:cullin 3
MHGSVDIKPILYTTKPFIFVMNSYQAVILLLFNKYNELTYTQIKQMTNIPEGELNPALIYLCNPKNRVVEKENMKKPEFAPEEKMKIAAAFQNPNVKVVFTPPTTHKKKEGPEAGKSEKDVADDKEIRMERQNIIDAVIVRIMKARKTEKHNQLMEDVIKQISIFLPQPQMIKQRIESLIEREYLKRDEADRAKYIYLP